MTNFSRLLSMAGELGIDPKTRGAITQLLQQGGGQAAAATAPDYSNVLGKATGEPLSQGPPTTSGGSSFPLNPVFQPPSEQALGLTGNTPVGGSSAASLGSALLGGQSNPEPARPKVAGFQDTTGGKMAMALLERRKNLKWWMPDQFANRNERDVAQAIDLARVEMGGSDAQDVSAQRWANLLQDQERAKASQTHAMASLSEAQAKREQEMEEANNRLALDRDRLLLSTKQADEENKDRAAGRDYREKTRRFSEAYQTDELGLRRDELGLRKAALDAKPPTAAPWEKLFGEYLAGPAAIGAPDAEVAQKKEQLQRLFGAPTAPGGSGPLQAARVAVDPKTKKRFYVYQDGRVEAAP